MAMLLQLAKSDPNKVRSKNKHNRIIYRNLAVYVEKIVDRHELKVQKAELWQKNGVSSFVVILYLKKRKLVLKVSGRDDLAGEVFFFKKLRVNKLPVPKILFFDTNKKFIPFMYHISEFVNGKVIYDLNSKEMKKVSVVIGQVLVKLNRVKVNGFGMLLPNGQWSGKIWTSVLRDGFLYKEMKPINIKNALGSRIYNVLEDILSDRRMEVKQPYLIHGDLGEDQFIIDKMRDKLYLKAILDPGDLIGGDYLFDLAYGMISWNKLAYRRGIEEGYMSKRKFTSEEEYRFSRLCFLTQAFAAAFIHKSGSRGSKGLIDDTLKLGRKLKLL